jgi:hypothetical protein
MLHGHVRFHGLLPFDEPAAQVAAAGQLGAHCATLRTQLDLVDLPRRWSVFGPTRLPTDALALLAAICDATLVRPDVDPDRGSFTVALNTARDQVIKAAGVLAETTVDLVGVIGRQVLAHLLPDRRCRTTPRVVKRVISNYAPNTAKGRIRAPNYRATISIDVLDAPGP